MPPASVKVYEVLGAKIARGWSRVNPVSPVSPPPRQGAPEPALNAASRSHDGIARFTEKRPTTELVATARSNSTVMGASAATPTDPRFGINWMIWGGLAKHPESEATIIPAPAHSAARPTADARRPRGVALVGAVERGVDVDGGDGPVAALDLDARLPIRCQRGHRGRRLVKGSLGFGVGPEDVAIVKQDDPRLGRGLHHHRPADLLLGEVLQQRVQVHEASEQPAEEIPRREELRERGDHLRVQFDDVDDAVAGIHVAPNLQERRFSLYRGGVAAERLECLPVVQEDDAAVATAAEVHVPGVAVGSKRPQETWEV